MLALSTGPHTDAAPYDGQHVLVAARWLLIGTGLALSFWDAPPIGQLRTQLSALVALAFANFYLHLQLMRARPADPNVAYVASAADLAVITVIIAMQGGIDSTAFVFYFPAALAFSVAFPFAVSATFAGTLLLSYASICLDYETMENESALIALFTRVVMLGGVVSCGALYRHLEERRSRAEVPVLDSAN